MKSDSWLSILCAFVLFLGLAATANSIYANAHVEPKIALSMSDWRVSFNITSGCDLESEAKKECPASPESALWTSPVTRDSDSFLKRYETEAGGAFWMGLRVPPETLKAAAKAGASTLVLSHINGTVQVWLDGVYQTTHDFSQQRMPLQLPISKSRLRADRELVIALGVFPYPHQPVPERRAEVREGFFTALDADQLSRSTIFSTTSQNLIAVALFLLVGCFLWSVSSSGRTRYYAVGTQLSLLVALISLLSVDLSFQVFSVARYESIYFSLLMLEAFLIARFTWTILKGSRTTSWREALALAVCLLIPNIFNFYQWIESVGVNLMAGWILPLTYLASAVAISIRLQKTRNASRTRVQFLVITAISMFATALAYFVESRHQSGFHVVWSRWLNLIVLMGLVRVFTKSHQTKSSLIEMSPASSYHRLDPLPEKVEGWILQFNVQKFSRDRQVMSTVISHLWTISKLNDGEVIKADEGTLVILFTSDEKVQKALDEMAKCVSDLERRLPIVLTTQAKLRFRAAVLKGALKPAFKSGEGGSLSQIPTWHDVDGTLATAASMMAEAGEVTESVVLMKESEAFSAAVGVPIRSVKRAG